MLREALISDGIHKSSANLEVFIFGGDPQAFHVLFVMKSHQQDDRPGINLGGSTRMESNLCLPPWPELLMRNEKSMKDVELILKICITGIHLHLHREGNTGSSRIGPDR
ncbi:uncharacterized protein LOC132642358 [Lycium barbarum]|uniref:uncharacterized protein LOC132642358 n=1 Tax=Lycium barbarum TaxID=112863 RepID=UPI00293EEF1B|nr:uncharacterized protein LOC132642358 [Lycium barbarum]